MELSQTAPASSFAGRFQFLESWAAVLHGDVRRAESILERGLEIADLREGETSTGFRILAGATTAILAGLCYIWSTGGMSKPLLAEGSDRQTQLVERGGNSKACWLLDCGS
jgi:hypothetical protein